ncbi:hypothetical protein C6502_08035 [Candidatus Poribacteria bacterium]|nr:MAG: hypothetical protein C6502_08035 [Candidatus Poribacteria bacterium]
MHRRYNLAHLILAGAVVLVLTLMVCADAQAQIAFVSHREGNPQIYVMDINGGNPQNLSNNHHNDWQPSWSPDGKQIVFVSNRDGHFLGNIPAYEIYVMDADGKNQLNLTNNLGDDRSPSWSPDGKRITFVSERVDRDERPHRDIYVMDANGKNQQRLTNNPKHDDWQPSWSPDGKQIVFHSNREGNYDIYVMDADGGNQQRLTNNPHSDVSPAWFVPTFAVTPTGKP